MISQPTYIWFSLMTTYDFSTYVHMIFESHYIWLLMFTTYDFHVHYTYDFHVHYIWYNFFWSTAGFEPGTYIKTVTGEWVSDNGIKTGYLKYILWFWLHMISVLYYIWFFIILHMILTTYDFHILLHMIFRWNIFICSEIQKSYVEKYLNHM